VKEDVTQSKADLVTNLVESQMRGNLAMQPPDSPCIRKRREKLNSGCRTREKMRERGVGSYMAHSDRWSFCTCMHNRIISEDHIMLAIELSVAVVVRIPTSSGSLT
jgi:hypothetical protein